MGAVSAAPIFCCLKLSVRGPSHAQAQNWVLIPVDFGCLVAVEKSTDGLETVVFDIGEVELSVATLVLQGLLTLRFLLIFLLAFDAKPCEREDF